MHGKGLHKPAIYKAANDAKNRQLFIHERGPGDLHDVLLRSGDVARVLPEVGWLPGFAALVLGIAFALFRRRV